jgi:hypothetical protein
MDGKDLLIRQSELFGFRKMVAARFDAFSEMLLSIPSDDSIE